MGKKFKLPHKYCSYKFSVDEKIRPIFSCAFRFHVSSSISSISQLNIWEAYALKESRKSNHSYRRKRRLYLKIFALKVKFFIVFCHFAVVEVRSYWHGTNGAISRTRYKTTVHFSRRDHLPHPCWYLLPYIQGRLYKSSWAQNRTFQTWNRIGIVIECGFLHLVREITLLGAIGRWQETMKNFNFNAIFKIALPLFPDNSGTDLLILILFERVYFSDSLKLY